MPPPFGFSPARLRFSACHPFFEDGDLHRHWCLAMTSASLAQEVEDRGGLSPPAPLSCQASPQCAGQAFRSLQDYEHHYQLRHRHACSACGSAFPSAHLLDLHLLEGHHDALFRLMAQKHNMYQCLVESCAEKFKSRKDRKDHLVKVHQYPPDFCFDKPIKSKSTKETRPYLTDGSIPMDVNVESYDQAQADAMETGCSESAMEKVPKPEMGNSLDLLPSSKHLYKSRIPPTICFGQEATRAFEGRKKTA